MQPTKLRPTQIAKFNSSVNAAKNYINVLRNDYTTEHVDFVLDVLDKVIDNTSVPALRSELGAVKNRIDILRNDYLPSEEDEPLDRFQMNMRLEHLENFINIILALGIEVKDE